MLILRIIHNFDPTSYRSGLSEAGTSLKRYKYVYKELDNETGLYNYGMRYYAPHIARFVNVDPLQFDYPIYTPFQYAGNKPISNIDLDGLEDVPAPLGPSSESQKPLPRINYNPAFLGLPQDQVRDRTQSMDNFNSVQSNSIGVKEAEPWIVFGYDKPFKLYGYTIAHASGYYEGERGFYERGGLSLLLTTMLSVGTAGFGGGTNILKKYWCEGLSVGISSRLKSTVIQFGVNYASNISNHGWGLSNIYNHNLTGYLTGAFNTSSSFSSSLISTYGNSLVKYTVEDGFSSASNSEFARDLFINSSTTSIFGKINGGIFFQRANLLDEVTRFRGLKLNNSGGVIGGARIDIARNNQFLYNGNILRNQYTYNLLKVARPTVSAGGGLLRNYSKTFFDE